MFGILSVYARPPKAREVQLSIKARSWFLEFKDFIEKLNIQQPSRFPVISFSVSQVTRSYWDSIHTELDLVYTTPKPDSIQAVWLYCEPY